ncbi:PD-(D/E)XK nuclease family protein [Dechloromonas sp. H13]|uniref:PD-(D/E)XK nuclease family protein n=1 Tax=Dechloromonas sp. H13 TaxID=2570193 RepID=UPI00188535FA|nr:PD-(D/E)XK nuclease family protein [Dechloromonas sp. H13]
MTDRLLLCATSRLAQTLRGMAPGNAAVWQTPRALTVAQWLATLADEALLSGTAVLPQALDPFAEVLLWEKVIADSLPDDSAPLFDIQGMAASAAEAHALTRVWQLSLPAAASAAEETRRFLAWQGEFLKRCRAAQAIDPAGQQALVVEQIERGRLQLPAEIEFAGFDRETPFEARLKRALAERGCLVVARPAGRQAAEPPTTLRCPDPAAECAAVAAWAQRKLAVAPQARLAIVAPDLAAIRDPLAFALDDVLHPGLIRPAAAEAARTYNISLGRPLAAQPLVATALELIALAGGGKVEQSRLGALLRAPDWSAAASEGDGRARLDAAMRRDLPYFIRPAALLRLAVRLAGAGDPPPCPQTTEHLAALLDAATAAGGRRRPLSQWAALFRQWLRTAGWPGERSLSSHEYQARRAFSALLDSLGSLDGVLGPLSQGEAARRLAQLCRQRIFQPETRGQPAIQVLGILESAGLEFDALWVMGMSDDAWPPAPRPNPLLPAELLRQAGAAHASAEVELEFASCVHARLLQAAPEVVFSYPASAGNRLLRRSPLLAGLAAMTDAPAPAATLAQRLAAEAPDACVGLLDAQAPPVGDGERVAGGTWLLRAQAICPAWGYFRYRLAGEALEAPVEGLDPRARGTLVHGALEAFWRTTGDSATLAVMSDAARGAAIATAVATALAEFENARRSALPTRFRQLEGIRLARLLATWLDFEAQRGAPFTVVACEQEALVEIEQIRVKMFVDRIDQLADGRRIIIDYKTGATIDTKNWASERLTEPQLPIYAALASPEPVAAVVFAKVLADKPAFAGVAEERDLLPGIAGVGDDKQKLFDPAQFPDWAAVVRHWQARLQAVAGEVRAGVAGVVVADENLLAYCDVRPLLRLAERRRQLERAAAGGRA